MGNAFLVGQAGGGGDAVAADLYLNKTATVDAGLITGTNPYKPGSLLDILTITPNIQLFDTTYDCDTNGPNYVLSRKVSDNGTYSIFGIGGSYYFQAVRKNNGQIVNVPTAISSYPSIAMDVNAYYSGYGIASNMLSRFDGGAVTWTDSSYNYTCYSVTVNGFNVGLVSFVNTFYTAYLGVISGNGGYTSYCIQAPYMTAMTSYAHYTFGATNSTLYRYENLGSTSNPTLAWSMSFPNSNAVNYIDVNDAGVLVWQSQHLYLYSLAGVRQWTVALSGITGTVKGVQILTTGQVLVSSSTASAHYITELRYSDGAVVFSKNLTTKNESEYKYYNEATDTFVVTYPRAVDTGFYTTHRKRYITLP